MEKQDEAFKIEIEKKKRKNFVDKDYKKN